MMDFLDEQRMSHLYEKFILEYYRREHPELSAGAPYISWALDDGFDDMLPAMHTDITLARGMTALISSHNLRELEDLCDHVAILHEGRLLMTREMDNLHTITWKRETSTPATCPRSSPT